MRAIVLSMVCTLLICNVADVAAGPTGTANTETTQANSISPEEKADADIAAAVKAWEREQQLKAAQEKKEAGTQGGESTGPKIGPEGGGIEPMESTLSGTHAEQGKQP